MTGEQYMEMLKYLQERNPAEVLLRVLRSGHSKANEVYLKAAMKRCPDDIPDLKARTPYADETLRGLWSERTRLFGEMNRQSNKFHECKNDEQRAENSRRVLAWWSDILAAKSKIEWYEIHGELPPADDDGEQLPDNPVALGKKLNSLRARASQVKKKLVDLAGLDPNTPGREGKIHAAENDLKHLRFLIGKAEMKLGVYEQE